MRKRIVLLLAVTLLMLAGVGITTYAASNDNNVEWDGVFHDQGPIYMTPQAPLATDDVKVRLRVFKSDITSAQVKYYDSADSLFHSVNMYWLKNDTTGVFDLWEGVIPKSASTKWYRFRITDGTKTVWMNTLGVSDAEPSSGDFWDVPGYATPAWVKDAIFYQIFPDRFYNGDTTNDVKNGEYLYFGVPVVAKNWTDPIDPNNAYGEFYNGDLVGVYQKLQPYLQTQLGINAIYLNPIFLAPNNHKYDTQDYYTVDPHFGGNTALQTLLTKAHSTSDFTGDYNVRVILDGVLNHTGMWHYWFDKTHQYTSLGAYESQTSQWYSYYTFNTWPDNYVAWWGYQSMPKLDYASSALRDEMYRSSTSVIKRYLNTPYGIDGWRLDVANEVGMNGTTNGNHTIMAELRTNVKAVNPNAYIVGEYWESSQDWLKGNEWDGSMNYYGFNTPVSNWITGKDTHNNAQAIDTNTFNTYINQRLASVPRQAQLAMFNSLSTHDTARFLYRAGGDIWKLKLAAIFQMTFVGTPCIYYGDEIGMTGSTDPYNRGTFNWTTTSWNQDIFNLYKKLISIRKSYTALRTGSFKTLYVNNTEKTLAFGRWDDTHRIIVALNNDSTSHNVTVNAWQLSIPNGATVTDAISGKTYTVVNGQITVSALYGHDGVILVH